MEALFSCEFCGNYMGYKDKYPRVLCCGHTFCTPCVEEFFRGGNYTCPNCSYRHHSETLSNVPVNHALLKFIKGKDRSLPVCSKKEDTYKKSSPDTETKSSSDRPDCPLDNVDKNLKEPPEHAGRCEIHDGYYIFWCKCCKVWLCLKCAEISHLSGKCEILPYCKAIAVIKLEGDHCIKRTVDYFDQHATKYRQRQSALNDIRGRHRALTTDLQRLLSKHQKAKKEIERQIEVMNCCLAEGLNQLLPLLESQGKLLEAKTIKDVMLARQRAQVCQSNILVWHNPANLVDTEAMEYSKELQKSSLTALAVLRYSLSSSKYVGVASQASAFSCLTEEEEKEVITHLGYLMGNPAWKEMFSTRGNEGVDTVDTLKENEQQIVGGSSGCENPTPDLIDLSTEDQMMPGVFSKRTRAENKPIPSAETLPRKSRGGDVGKQAVDLSLLETRENTATEVLEQFSVNRSSSLKNYFTKSGIGNELFDISNSDICSSITPATSYTMASTKPTEVLLPTLVKANLVFPGRKETSQENSTENSTENSLSEDSRNELYLFYYANGGFDKVTESDFEKDMQDESTEDIIGSINKLGNDGAGTSVVMGPADENYGASKKYDGNVIKVAQEGKKLQVDKDSGRRAELEWANKQLLKVVEAFEKEGRDSRNNESDSVTKQARGAATEDGCSNNEDDQTFFTPMSESGAEWMENDRVEGKGTIAKDEGGEVISGCRDKDNILRPHEGPLIDATELENPSKGDSSVRPKQRKSKGMIDTPLENKEARGISQQTDDTKVEDITTFSDEGQLKHDVLMSPNVNEIGNDVLEVTEEKKEEETPNNEEIRPTKRPSSKPSKLSDRCRLA